MSVCVGYLYVTDVLNGGYDSITHSSMFSGSRHPNEGADSRDEPKLHRIQVPPDQSPSMDQGESAAEVQSSLCVWTEMLAGQLPVEVDQNACPVFSSVLIFDNENK